MTFKGVEFRCGPGLNSVIVSPSSLFTLVFSTDASSLTGSQRIRKIIHRLCHRHRTGLVSERELSLSSFARELNLLPSLPPFRPLPSLLTPSPHSHFWLLHHSTGPRSRRSIRRLHSNGNQEGIHRDQTQVRLRTNRTWSFEGISFGDRTVPLFG